MPKSHELEAGHMERLHGDGSRQDLSRVCVGLLVAAAHLLVLRLLVTATWKRPETDSMALTLINIAAPKQTLLESLPRIDPPELKMSMPRLADSQTASVPSTSESAATVSPPAIHDWRGSLEGAATAAVERVIKEQGYRAFGPVERERTTSQSPPSIFEAPRHKAGDIEYDAVQGRTVIWNTENCYTELKFPTVKDPNEWADRVLMRNLPQCVMLFGDRKPRDDLFEPLKKQ